MLRLSDFFGPMATPASRNTCGTQSATMNMHALSGVLLELHRLGREAAYATFQPRALECIKDIIAFDSAWWGNAAAEPLEIHRIYVYNCADTILADYLPHMEEDFFRAALLAAPGTTINMSDLTTRARFTRTRMYRQVGKRYRIEWSLGTLLVEPVSSLNEFLTLWRHDPAKPFSETDRQTKELLMPHLADAHREARMRALLEGENVHHGHWAVADERGFLREITPGFNHRIRDVWPDWRGSRLPAALLPSVRSATPYNSTGRLKLAITRKGDFRFLQVPAGNLLDRLTTRERDIAVRYARGASHAQIADALQLARSTVRNHIARCFSKLAVDNKAALALRIAPLIARD